MHHFLITWNDGKNEVRVDVGWNEEVAFIESLAYAADCGVVVSIGPADGHQGVAVVKAGDLGELVAGGRDG